MLLPACPVLEVFFRYAGMRYIDAQPEIAEVFPPSDPLEAPNAHENPALIDPAGLSTDLRRLLDGAPDEGKGNRSRTQSRY